MCVSPSACTHVYMPHVLVPKGQRVCWTSRSRVIDGWVLGTKPGSPSRPANDLACWAISPAPTLKLLLFSSTHYHYKQNKTKTKLSAFLHDSCIFCSELLFRAVAVPQRPASPALGASGWSPLPKALLSSSPPPGLMRLLCQFSICSSLFLCPATHN